MVNNNVQSTCGLFEQYLRDNLTIELDTYHGHFGNHVLATLRLNGEAISTSEIVIETSNEN